MRRRALLLGSQTAGLSGVHRDVAAMQRLLAGHGFTVDLRIAGDATRAGILDGYARLVADTRPDDAVIVYYSGHGAYATVGAPGSADARHLQCIVPTDWGERGEFRGLLGAELSALLADLTARTDNAAVILDCCHAARMSREPAGPAFVRRSLAAPWTDGVEAFARRNAIDLAGPGVESNPRAVRLVATEVDRAAYEAVDPTADPPASMGLMTQALRTALGEFGERPISWYALALRVRELVMARRSGQRPEIEGPADRLLFRTATAARCEAAVFFYDRGRPALRAGPLQGARVGALYELVRAGPIMRGGPAVIAEATVTDVAETTSYVALRRLAGAEEPTAGALAVPRELPFGRLAVAVRGDDAAVSAASAAIAGSRFLAVAPPGPAVPFEVVARDVGLELRTDDGDVVLRSVAADRLARLVAALERHARAEALRDLPPGGLPAAAVAVRAARVLDGRTTPLDPGDTLHVGDAVGVTVENCSDDELYVAVFDIDVDGSIALLTELAPTGRRLPAGQRVTLPEADGRARGFAPLAWPAEVPSDGPRTRSLAVVIADGWHDFRLLTTTRGADRRSGSRLEALLAAVRGGSARAFAAATQQQVGRYLVVRIAYRLSPSPRLPHEPTTVDGHEEERAMKNERAESETKVCTLKFLPRDKWLEAARTARDINPDNVPPGVILEEMPSGSDRLAVEIHKYWGRDGVRLTVGFLDNPPAELRRKILAHMNEWSKYANITFTEARAADAQVRVARERDGYWSYLGTDILQISRDQPTMNLEGFTIDTPESEFVRVVRHETGHTLGFPHEHCRADIVDRLDREKTIRYFKRVYGWDRQTTMNQVLTPIAEEDIVGTPRAEDISIMCYQLPAEITTDNRPIPGGLDISELDRKFVAMIYPKPGRAMPEHDLTRGAPRTRR